jgi:hypothetical protein
MRVFTIHLRRTALSPDRDAVLIKEGFCWPAFFFGPFWALWHRMWFLCLGIFAVAILMGVAEVVLQVDPMTYSAISIGVAALIGFSANDWRRSALTARGWEMTGLSAAGDPDSALRRFLDLHPEILETRASAAAGGFNTLATNPPPASRTPGY